MAKKKTTLMIPEALYERAQEIAVQERITVSSVFADALLVYLDRRSRPRKRIVLPVATGGGWMGPPDPRSNAELWGAACEDPIWDRPI